MKMHDNEETLGTRDLASAAEPASDERAAPSGFASSGAPTEANEAPTATDTATSDTDGDSGSALGGDVRPRSDHAGAPAAGDAARPSASDGGEPLLAAELTDTFSRRWEEVQTQFVDQPRGAVEAADRLVAALMKQLAEDFAREREQLEVQWDRGENISTEDLRVALQRYRSFFRRLLST